MVEMNGEDMIIYRQINLHDKFRNCILNFHILFYCCSIGSGGCTCNSSILDIIHTNYLDLHFIFLATSVCNKYVDIIIKLEPGDGYSHAEDTPSTCNFTASASHSDAQSRSLFALGGHRESLSG